MKTKNTRCSRLMTF